MTPEEKQELIYLRRLVDTFLADYSEKMIVIHEKLGILMGDHPPKDLFSHSIYDDAAKS